VSPDDRPACRAAVRGGVVTLNRWTPALAARGPMRAGLRSVDAALADLVQEGDELIVVPVRDVPWDAEAERTLLAWARLVGYRRVWVPGGVALYAQVLAPLGRAGVTCPTCGARWEDEDLTFWEGVRRLGWFPGACMACGGSLPEWRLGEEDVRAPLDGSGADAIRGCAGRSRVREGA
jgi:hypothetical protein